MALSTAQKYVCKESRERERDIQINLRENEMRDVFSSLIPEGYIVGLGRDYPHPKLAHLYKGDINDPGLPMCKHGWNRDGGTAYSIWRGNYGRQGVCKVCLARAKKGLEGVPANDNK